MSKHSTQSTFREKIVEYDFLSKLLKKFWNTDDFRAKMSRLDIDNGIDLVCIIDEKTYTIQLKSKLLNDKNLKKCKVDIDLKASENTNYLLIVILVDDELNSSKYQYRLLDQNDIAKKNLKKSKHSKANSDGIKTIRKNKRRISVKAVDKVSFDQIFAIIKG